MEGYSQLAQRGRKRKVRDFLSADVQGCSSTSAETFKQYEPSPTHHHKRYHVFLSFRGTDVRDTFVDHLFKSLSTAGFHVFLDSERLEKGKNFAVSLDGAIRNSTVFIPIFSTNYATSPWCLKELSLIWTSKSTETPIIPLFYNVKPSDVRYPEKEQTPYADAFQKHRKEERHTKEEIDAWKEALHQVSYLSGWSLAETPARNENELLKLVVTDLQKVLPIKDQHVAKYPVGLSDPMKEVRTLLEMDNHSRQVLFVGIWGMGGLGKTTLAKEVYNKVRRKFKESCFVPDVRASTKESGKGLLKLQKQILRSVAKVNESTLKMFDSVSNAKIQMKSLLRSIKALVVLDDVDDPEQLDALVGDDSSGNWFAAGSRIIITTRDKQVWERHLSHVKEYIMRGLDQKESLELFSWHAFKRPAPAEGYEDVTKKIVDVCKGLPLSLEVVGASLYLKKLEIWDEAVANLVKHHQKLYNTLRISYDALTGEEKRMFLDIACFFLGPLSLPSTRYDMKFYVELWKALDCSAPRTCLANLEMKSLIRINSDGYHSDYHYMSHSIFWMHDNLRDMGRQIIEEAFPSNPAEHTRFWRPKDLVTRMAQTQEMPMVEGLVLDFSQAEEGLHHKYCSTDPGALMRNLKFMFISGLCKEGPTNLPPNIIFLGLLSCRFQEDESASETEPISFCLAKTIGELSSLRFLDMTGTSIYHLPNEVEKFVDLEELYLSKCNLRELSQSFGNLIKLKVLDISYNHISSFPAKFHLPSSLTKLHLNNCSNLQELSGISHLKKLEALDLSGCTSLKKFPSFDSMDSLRDLRLGGYEELQALPALPDTLSGLYLNGCSKLQEVSDISHLKKLEILNLSGCTSLTKLPSLHSMRSLIELHLKGCEELQALPALPYTVSRLSLSGCRKLQKVSSISNLKKLEALDLSGCTSLTELPSLDFMLYLIRLHLIGCKELQALPYLPDTLSDLRLCDCSKLQEVSSISSLKKMEFLSFYRCTSLRELPLLDSMHSLIELQLDYCKKLQALPALPATLGMLTLYGCSKMQEVSSISHLEKVELIDLSKCTSLTKLPPLHSLCSLIKLWLEDCRNLQVLPALPDTLSGLYLNGCCKLQEVSSISQLKKLEALDLSGCTSLTELPSLDSMHSLRDLRLGGYEQLQSLPALSSTLNGKFLNGCRKLQQVSSISHLKKLEALDLSGCTSLTELPSLASMHYLRDLRLGGYEELQTLPALPDTVSHLSLNGCGKLQEVSSISHLKKMEHLDLSGCTSLNNFPSFDSMDSLRDLRLGGYKELQVLPALPDTLSVLYLDGCSKLQEVSGISYLKKLEVLNLSGCTSLMDLPSLDSMHSLIKLLLQGCKELQALPALPDTVSHLSLFGCRKLPDVSSISHLKKMEQLCFSSTSLRELPPLDSMHSLRELLLECCKELQALPALPDTVINLPLDGCCKLQDVSNISHLKKVKYISLSECTSLKELPSLHSMHSLTELLLEGCEELQALPALPNTLSRLSLNGCCKLQEVFSISDLKKLKTLDLSGCTSLIELPSLDLMHSLTDLKLGNCEELQALPALPDTVSRLSLNGCRKLQEVSSISHLKKLKVLNLSGCTSLTELS